MTRFVIRLVLIYAILSVIGVGGCIFWIKKTDRDNAIPRKELFVVNLSNDTIYIYLSGNYTKQEKRLLKDKPDRDILTSSSEETLPYSSMDGTIHRAACFYIPHKKGKDIRLPDNFEIHIRCSRGSITLNRKQFFEITHGRTSDDSWTLYVTDFLIEQTIKDTSKQLDIDN